MKNILFIHQSAELYGSDKTLLLLLKYLDKSKYNPLVVLPNEGPLKQELEKENMSIEDAFKITKSQHPYIIKAFLRKTITLETLVILEKIFPFTGYFDKNIGDDVMWPDISRLIRKYKPFLRFDKEKYNGIFRNRAGLECSKNS